MVQVALSRSSEFTLPNATPLGGSMCVGSLGYFLGILTSFWVHKMHSQVSMKTYSPTWKCQRENRCCCNVDFVG